MSLALDRRQAASRPWPASWLVCGLVAASPDLDLLVPGFHRSATHSFFAAAMAGFLVAVGSWVRFRQVRWGFAAVCACAYASHVVTDYFGVDLGDPAGVQALWPWSTQTYISEWSIFRATERINPFSALAIRANTLALAQELALLGPVAWWLWRRRRNAVSRPGERLRARAS